MDYIFYQWKKGDIIKMLYPYTLLGDALRQSKFQVYKRTNSTIVLARIRSTHLKKINLSELFVVDLSVTKSYMVFVKVNK